MITDIITKLKEKIEFCEKHEPQYGVTQDYAEGRLGAFKEVLEWIEGDQTPATEDERKGQWLLERICYAYIDTRDEECDPLTLEEAKELASDCDHLNLEWIKGEDWQVEDFMEDEYADDEDVY